jgi:hypothetical protein
LDSLIFKENLFGLFFLGVLGALALLLLDQSTERAVASAVVVVKVIFPISSEQEKNDSFNLGYGYNDYEEEKNDFFKFRLWKQ